MKQKLLNSFTWRGTLLVALLSCAFTSAWGQVQGVLHYTLDGTQSTQTQGSNDYTQASTITQNSITWKVEGNTASNPWQIGGKIKNGATRNVYSINSMNETIAEVKLEVGTISGVTFTNPTLIVASNADFSNVIETVTFSVTANSTISIKPSFTSGASTNEEWVDAYYKFVFNVKSGSNNNSYFQLKNIKFYKKNDPVFNITSASILFGKTKLLSSGTSGTEDVKTDGTVTLKSGNENIATISGLGISTVSVGMTNLTIDAAFGPYYKAGSKTIPLTITAPQGQSVAGTDPISVKFNASGYATFCSQYPLDFTNATDYSAWIVTGVDNSTDVLIEQVTGAVKGGTGLLLKGEPGATITLTSAYSETVPSGNKLVGLLAPTYIEDGTYYGLRGKDFLKIESSAAADRIAPAGKAVLPASEVTTVPDGVKTLNLVFNDGTGIREIQTVSAEEAAEIFNLAGQRLQKAQRGVNIVNGKKVLVK